MKVSVSTFQTTGSAPVQDLARDLEERGYDALYFCEHTHQSSRVARQKPDLERRFRETFDPFVSAHAAAAVTERLRVGSAVSLLAQHEPIAMAKRLATLDRLVGGRLDVGVGAGWIEDEMVTHGVDPKRRNGHLAAHARAVKALWSGEPVTFSSPYVSFEEIVVRPTPSQRPGPPVYVAGAGPRSVERVRDFGDGWMPDYGSVDPRTFFARREQVRELEQETGRRVPVVVMGVPHDPRVIESLAAAGVDQVATLAPSAPLTEIRAFLASFEASLRAALGGESRVQAIRPGKPHAL